MKKLHITVSLLLSAVMLLTGCSKDEDESTDPNEQISSEVSDDASGLDTSHTEDENSGADPVQSSVESKVQALTEFTDEDLELQKILSDLQTPVEEILHWYSNMIPPAFDPLELKFPQFGSESANHYVMIPNNFRARDEISPFAMPETRTGMREIMFDHFSEEFTETYISNILTGTLSKNSDGTFSVTLTSEPGQFSDDLYPTFLELNGRLYRLNIIKPISLDIDFNTAKITAKTDDSIEFTYLHRSAKYQGGTKYMYQTFYSENALKGSLKYERDGWKLDSFGQRSQDS